MSRVPESSPAIVLCFLGGGGGKYVTTLAFFCGGCPGVMVRRLNGSLNFPLFASSTLGLALPPALRPDGFKVDHSESGEGGSWS